MTVQYAKDRVQFGSPIGRYQGVKHRLSDMWVDTESIKSLVYYGAWAIDNGREELARYASLSKAYVADAFTGSGSIASSSTEPSVTLGIRHPALPQALQVGDRCTATPHYHRDGLATGRL